jgi:hypothetical protein
MGCHQRMKPCALIRGVAGFPAEALRGRLPIRVLLILLLAVPCGAVANDRQCHYCVNAEATSPGTIFLPERMDEPGMGAPGSSDPFSFAIRAAQLARHGDTDDSDRGDEGLRSDQYHRRRSEQSDRRESPERHRRHEDRRRRFEALPQDQQQRLLDTRERFLHLPPEDRERLRQRWRELSPEDRRRWRESESHRD